LVNTGLYFLILIINHDHVSFRTLSHRRAQERVPMATPHRLRPGYEYAAALQVPQPLGQQPRYLAEGTDW